MKFTRVINPIERTRAFIMHAVNSSRHIVAIHARTEKSVTRVLVYNKWGGVY